jgi:hypothetical protein
MASGSQSSVGGGSGSSNGVADATNGVDDAETGVVNAKFPLWAHVSKVLVNETGRGGNTRFRCHFCNLTFLGSYSRVKYHLLQQKGNGVAPCNKMPHDVFVQLCKDDAAANVLINNGPTRRTVPLPPSDGSSQSRKRKAAATKQTGITESFNLETKQQADALIARMFITGGMQMQLFLFCKLDICLYARMCSDVVDLLCLYIVGVPFNLARNPYYRESYNFIASHHMAGYVPLGYNALRTTLLEKEKKHTMRMLEPIKTTWPLKGVTICTDGWSDPQRQPI